MLNSSREGAFLNSRLGVKIKLLEYAGNGKEAETKRAIRVTTVHGLKIVCWPSIYGITSFEITSYGIASVVFSAFEENPRRES